MTRDKRFIIGGALLALIVVFALLAQLTDYSQLKAFSQQLSGASKHTGLEEDGIANTPAELDGLEPVLGSLTEAEEDGFTLVAPTYKRLSTLPDWIKHYASGDVPSLKRILVIWPKVQGDAPESLLQNVTQYPVPVIIDQRDVNTLNGRFMKTDDIKTGCVLAMDDDMTYEHEDVEFAYQVWKEYGEGRARMSGMIARASDADSTGYRISHLTDYSMVLTKTAFFHTDWMGAYWSDDERMTRLRNYVDDHFNCEDILMSFMHAHYSRKPPLYVRPHSMFDVGTKSGISVGKNHLKHRADCVKYFSEEFGKDTLVSSNIVYSRM